MLVTFILYARQKKSSYSSYLMIIMVESCLVTLMGISRICQFFLRFYVNALVVGSFPASNSKALSDGPMVQYKDACHTFVAVQLLLWQIYLGSSDMHCCSITFLFIRTGIWSSKIIIIFRPCSIAEREGFGCLGDY